ncbi:unnamed protein product [Calicophoron daubneyi]|uniref:Cyclic nucleotide-binding domain-containing protein n=1 Tax=Calicophoron daubneyi TaxID=300641 RepID=A0AAV2TD50_CALDB
MQTDADVLQNKLSDLMEEFERVVTEIKPTNLIQFASRYFTEKARSCPYAEPSLEIPANASPSETSAHESLRDLSSHSLEMAEEHAVTAFLDERCQIPFICNVSSVDCQGDKPEKDEPEDALGVGHLNTPDSTEVHGSVARRRHSVAAESYDPEAEVNAPLTVHPKSEDQRFRLREVVRPIFIFRSLDEEQLGKVIDAMEEMAVKKGQKIISQGEDGEYFYVIESGKYDIFVDEKRVASYSGSGSFVLFQAFRKRQLYESWLSSVPLLKNLSAYERTNLADALVSKEYEDGEFIINQGEKGDEMFFIEEGSVEISAKNSADEQKVIKTMKKDEYFGELALILHQPRQASARAIGHTKLAVLDVSSYERLMGPCLKVMLREAKQYRTELAHVLGESCLNSFPVLGDFSVSDKGESEASSEP